MDKVSANPYLDKKLAAKFDAAERKRNLKKHGPPKKRDPNAPTDPGLIAAQSMVRKVQGNMVNPFAESDGPHNWFPR